MRIAEKPVGAVSPVFARGRADRQPADLVVEKGAAFERGTIERSGKESE